MVFVNALFLKGNTIQGWSNYQATFMKIQNQYNIGISEKNVCGRKRF